MKVKQYIIGKDLTFFEKNFKERWALIQYFDQTAPLFFFGFVGLDEIFENHKSYKIILPSTPRDLPNFKKLKNLDHTILITEIDLPNDYYVPEKVKVVKLIIEIKDYSIFTPNMLGDKVYYYSGFSNGWQPNSKSLIDRIQKKIPFEIITTQHINKSDMFDISYLKKEFYDKSFVNLNFSNNSGMTTVREFGLMGRKTIVQNNLYPYSCLIKCKNEEDIVQEIMKESKKINSIQASMNVHDQVENWLDVNFLVALPNCKKQ